MDGVIYGGDELINGASEFISYLLKNNIPFLFMIDNCQRTRVEVVRKLNEKHFHFKYLQT